MTFPCVVRPFDLHLTPLFNTINQANVQLKILNLLVKLKRNRFIFSIKLNRMAGVSWENPSGATTRSTISKQSPSARCKRKTCNRLRRKRLPRIYCNESRFPFRRLIAAIINGFGLRTPLGTDFCVTVHHWRIEVVLKNAPWTVSVDRNNEDMGWWSEFAVLMGWSEQLFNYWRGHVLDVV